VLSSWTIRCSHHAKGKEIFMKEDIIEAAGLIIDKQPNAFFKVQLNNTDHIVLATISGRMRRNRIRILIGDSVDVEMSPYDLTKGRITYRHK
jgi:translation initiation factor IF-1